MFSSTRIKAGEQTAQLISATLPDTGVSLSAIKEFLEKLLPPDAGNRGVVINHSMPRWLHMYLTLYYRNAAWIGSWEPTIGVVVVFTNVEDVSLGDVLSPVS